MNNRERYAKVAHTVLELQYHFAWKTKYSYKVLNGDIALRLRDLIKEICSLQGTSIIRGNIRPDHIHILVRSPSHLSPAKVAQYLKGRTAHKLMREFSELRKRYWGCHLWGKGYFCSTVGAVTEEIVKSISKTKMMKILLLKYGMKRRIYPLSTCLQTLSILPALAGCN